MIDLNLVASFIEVSKTKNLRRAAYNLAVTPPALSQRISTLETQLGKSLFVRKSHGMELSFYGKQFLNICLDFDSNIKKIGDWILSDKGHIAGELTVASIESVMSVVLPDFLGMFLRKYPKVTVNLSESTSTRIEEDVMAEHADVGIIIGSCEKKALKAQLLLKNNDTVMVCSSSYFLAKKNKITDDDWRQAKVIWYSERYSRSLRIICHKLGIVCHEGLGEVKVPSMNYCKRYAEKGLGVTFVAKALVFNELKNGSLVKLPGFNLRQNTYSISRGPRYLPRHAALFEKELIEYCRKYDSIIKL